MAKFNTFATKSKCPVVSIRQMSDNNSSHVAKRRGTFLVN